MTDAPQQYQQPYGQPAPASDRYNVLAIVGFILAFFVALAGLICSIIALNQIKKNGERGHGLALAGVIVSIVVMVLTIGSYIAFFAIAANSGMSTNY